MIDMIQLQTNYNKYVFCFELHMEIHVSMHFGNCIKAVSKSKSKAFTAVTCLLNKLQS